MLRRLVILFVALSSAVTVGAVTASVANDLDVKCKDGHVWEDKSVVLNATCEEEGKLLQVCSVCGEEQEVSIKALGHELAVVPGSQVDPTCEEDGASATSACTREGCDYEVKGSVIDALGHEYGEFISVGDGTHKKVCANDSTHEIIEACTGGSATCTEKAICDVCDGEYGVLASHVYDNEVVDAKYLKYAANCQDSAVYYKSCDCGHFDEDESETFSYGSTAGHSYDREVVEAGFLASEATCEDAATYYLSCVCGEHGTETFTYGEALGHAWDNGVVTTDPTCETEGVKSFVCGNDASHTKTEAVDALGHAWDNGVVTIDPTCEGEGEKTFTCGNDASHTKTEAVDALGHAWDNGVVTTDPTCETEGEKTFTCGNDATHTKTEAVDALGHAWDNGVETTPATCTTAGEKTFTCGNDATHTKTEEIKAFGHTGSTEIVNTCATCGNAITVDEIQAMTKTLAESKYLTGKYQLTGTIVSISGKNILINVIGSTEKFEITAYNTTGDAVATLGLGDVITVSGAIKNYYGTIEFEKPTLDSVSHTITIKDTQNGTVTSSVEGLIATGTSVTITATPATGYELDNFYVDGEVVEVENGVYTVVVEKSFVVEVTFKVVGSQGEVVPTTITKTIEEIATANGWVNAIKYSTFDLDNVVSVSSTGGSNTAKYYTNGQNWRIYQGETGTFTISVTEDYKIISVKVGYVVDKTGIMTLNGTTIATGTEVEVNGTSITFGVSNTTNGVTNGQVRVNAITVKYVPATNEPACEHDYDEVVTDPTCEEEGYTTYTCSKCNDSYVGNKVDAIGHDYDGGVVTTPATCVAKGVKTYTCSHDASHTYTEEYEDATAHDYDEGVVTTPATCVAKGVKTYTCSHDASHTKTEDIAIDATAHDYDDGVVTDPTCEEEGYTTYTCECGYSYVDDEVDALGHTYLDTVLEDKSNKVSDATCKVYAVYYKVCACGEISATETFEDINGGKAPCVDEDDNNACDICGGVMCAHVFEGPWTSYDDEKHSRPCQNGCDKVEEATHTLATAYAVVEGELKLVSTCECGYSYNTSVNTEVAVPVANGKDLATVLTAGYDVVLSDDVLVEGGAIELTDGEMELDLAGYSLEVTGEKGPYYEGKMVCEAIYAHGNVTLTIKGEGTLYTNYDCDPGDYVGVISACDGAVINIEGGNYITNGCTAVYATRGGIVNIKAGYFKAQESEWTLDVNEAEAVKGIINVYGGKFVNFDPANHTNDGASYTNKVAEGYHSILVVEDETDVYVVSDHNYGELVEEVPAKCEEDGMKAYYYCADCGTYFDVEKNATTEEALVIGQIGHDYDDGVVTDPTCEADGYTTYTCSNCGDSYVGDEVVTEGHNYGELVAEVPATCTTAGMKAHYYCDACETYFDAEKNATTQSALTIAGGHNYVNGECTKCHAINKSVSFAFSSMGYANQADVTEVNKDSISIVFNKGSNSNAPKYYTSGTAVRAYGGNTITIKGKSITKVVFTYGSSDGSNAITANVGTFATNTWTGSADTIMFTIGGSSGNRRIAGITVTFNCLHTNKTATHKDATCTEDGYNGYKCDACGHSWNTEEFTATGHDEEMSFTEAKAATCVAEGNVAYYTCASCGGKFEDAEGTTAISNVVIAIDADNHAGLVDINGTPATCQSEGKTDGKECTACETIITAQTTIPKLDCVDEDPDDGICDSCGNDLCAHANQVVKEEISATCTEDGYKAGVYCEDCDKYLEGGEVISATGIHVYSDLVEKDSATHTYKCATCEERQTSNHELEVQEEGHDADKHNVACACGYTTTAEHDFTNGDCACGQAKPVQKSWKKATSIKAGDLVTLVCESKKMELSAMNSGNYGEGIEYSTAPVGKYALTVENGANAGTYSFKTSDGKYLSFTGSSNKLYTTTSKVESSSWTVTFESGNVNIANAATPARLIKWNAGSPRFACYTSAQTAIQLYVYA